MTTTLTRLTHHREVINISTVILNICHCLYCSISPSVLHDELIFPVVKVPVSPRPPGPAVARPAVYPPCICLLKIFVSKIFYQFICVGLCRTLALWPHLFPRVYLYSRWRPAGSMYPYTPALHRYAHYRHPSVPADCALLPHLDDQMTK